MKPNLAGICILITSLVFAYYETKFFGFNMYPLSAEECICDGIALVIASIGFATFKK